MNLALAAYESRRRLRGSLVLGGGLGVLGLLTVAFFPSVQRSGEELQAYLDSLPPAFREAFGVESFTTVGGFLASELYAFGWVLLLGLYFAYRAGGIVADDVERGRMDTLLATPLSRPGVVVQKYVSLLLPIVVVNVVSFVAVYAGIVAIGESIDLVDLAMVHALSVPYLLVCAAIGLLLSVGLQRSDLAERGALGAVFGLFLVETVAAVSDVEQVGLVSPTRYYDPTAILVHSAYDLPGALLLLVVAFLLLAASAAVFSRVDVR